MQCFTEGLVLGCIGSPSEKRMGAFDHSAQKDRETISERQTDKQICLQRGQNATMVQQAVQWRKPSDGLVYSPDIF